jgi:hypothetical protein
MGGDAFGRGINYVAGETMNSNSINESLSVQADDQTLYLASMGWLRSEVAAIGSSPRKVPRSCFGVC